MPLLQGVITAQQFGIRDLQVAVTRHKFVKNQSAMMSKLAGTLIFLSGFILLTNGDGLLDYYTFSVTDIEGNELSLEKYRGAVSKCLKTLHDKGTKFNSTFITIFVLPTSDRYRSL